MKESTYPKLLDVMSIATYVTKTDFRKYVIIPQPYHSGGNGCLCHRTTIYIFKRCNKLHDVYLDMFSLLSLLPWLIKYKIVLKLECHAVVGGLMMHCCFVHNDL